MTVDEAFEAVDRANFMPADVKHLAGVDEAAPIGYGQTISQPYTVRLMLQWLDPRPGQKILDVGSGSGWTTALLTKIVGPKSKVYAVERVSELVEFGRDNVERLNIKNVEFHQAGDELGLPEEAPFDRILVSAAAHELPPELVDQIKIGGRMIIPVHDDILEIIKLAKDKIDVIKHPGFIFVPLL